MFGYEKMTDAQVRDDVADWVKRVADEVQEDAAAGRADEAIREAVDGSRWVIYPAVARRYVAAMDTSAGEEWVADMMCCGETTDIDKMTTLVAYADLVVRVSREVERRLA